MFDLKILEIINLNKKAFNHCLNQRGFHRLVTFRLTLLMVICALNEVNLGMKTFFSVFNRLHFKLKQNICQYLFAFTVDYGVQIMFSSVRAVEIEVHKLSNQKRISVLLQRKNLYFFKRLI